MTFTAGPGKTNLGHTFHYHPHFYTHKSLCLQPQLSSVMVSKRAQFPTQEDTRGNSDHNAKVEMCATIEELCLQNQTLEDNVHKI